MSLSPNKIKIELLKIIIFSVAEDCEVFPSMPRMSNFLLVTLSN